MRWEESTAQTKEQDKVPEKQLSDPHEKEFRVIIGRLIQDLGKRMEA